MKLVLLALTLLIGFNSAALAKEQCSQTLLHSTQHLETIKAERTQYVKDLTEMNIGDNAYVVRWEARDEKSAGPLARQGEFVAAYIPADKRAEWLDKVGNDSIGFIVAMNFSGHTDYEGTAYLRIGSTVYPFTAIQNRDRVTRSMIGLRDLSKPGLFSSSADGYVEATIKMQPEEIAILKKFIETRLANRLTAQFEVHKRGYDPILPHTVIMPEFDATFMGLFKEGCAGACTSWASPDWQAHYPAEMKALQEITEKYGIVPSPVARQLVWRNARNPHTLGLTIIDNTGWYSPDSFIKQHSWGNLRGMSVYGTIPDPVGPSKTVDSKRIPLTEWLAEQKKNKDAR